MFFTALLYLFLFITGSVFGSFFNVVIDRWPNNRSVVKKRSHCEFCKKELMPQDLIPVVSFLLLKGRCRFCRKKLSWQYPIIEMTTGLLFVSSFIFSQNLTNEPVIKQFASLSIWQFLGLIIHLYSVLLSSYFLLIFMIDLKYEVILENIINSAIIVVFFYHFLFVVMELAFFNSSSYLLNIFLPALISAFAAGLFFRFLIFVSHNRGLGEGDVKLAFWLGLLTGFPKVIPAFFLSFIGGAIIGLLLVIFGKKKFGQTVPFAPFLVSGAYLALYWGDQIIRWYLLTAVI